MEPRRRMVLGLADFAQPPPPSSWYRSYLDFPTEHSREITLLRFAEQIAALSDGRREVDPIANCRIEHDLLAEGRLCFPWLSFYESPSVTQAVHAIGKD